MSKSPEACRPDLQGHLWWPFCAHRFDPTNSPKAPELCYIIAILFLTPEDFQTGKLIGPQTALKRPKGQEIKKLHENSPKSLSGRDKGGKWVFTKSFRARQREKTSLCRHLKSYPPLYGWNFMFGDGTPSTRKMFFRLSRPCFKPAKKPTTPERAGG